MKWLPPILRRNINKESKPIFKERFQNTFNNFHFVVVLSLAHVKYMPIWQHFQSTPYTISNRKRENTPSCPSQPPPHAMLHLLFFPTSLPKETQCSWTSPWAQEWGPTSTRSSLGGSAGKDLGKPWQWQWSVYVTIPASVCVFELWYRTAGNGVLGLHGNRTSPLTFPCKRVPWSK